MLLRANHKDAKVLMNGSLINVKRGQFIFGREKFSVEVGVPVRKVRRCLELLKSDQQISQQITNKYSIITITNYNQYQSGGQQSDQPDSQQTASKPPASDQQTATNNNVNNENNVNKSGRFTPPTLEQVDQYCRERGNQVDPQKFIDHYQSANWFRGKTKIKDWKAAVRTWERNSNTKTEPERVGV